MATVTDLKKALRIANLSSLDTGESQVVLQQRPPCIWYEGIHILAVAALNGIEVQNLEQPISINVEDFTSRLVLLDANESIRLALEKKNLVISTKDKKLSLRTNFSTPIPKRRGLQNSFEAVIDVGEFTQAVQFLSNITSRKILSFVMTGIKITLSDRVTLSAVDGYRAATISLKSDSITGEVSVVVPAADLLIAANSMVSDKAIFRANANGIEVVDKETKVCLSTLAEGDKFPSLTQLPMKHPVQVVVQDPSVLGMAAKASMLIDTSLAIKLASVNQRLLFSVRGQESGEFLCAVSKTVIPDFEIVLNAEHIRPLQMLQGPIRIALDPTQRNMVLVTDNRGWKCWIPQMIPSSTFNVEQ